MAKMNYVIGGMLIAGLSAFVGGVHTINSNADAIQGKYALQIERATRNVPKGQLEYVLAQDAVADKIIDDASRSVKHGAICAAAGIGMLCIGAYAGVRAIQNYDPNGTELGKSFSQLPRYDPRVLKLE